ncbi:DUF5020 family protein [Paraglaciecola arctica]|uniref:Nucleoside-binding outer membrane protein n=1 Tax=Paraglaciecola arctica BSs20135 TaxID=493475 RepID=K6YU05_9ALTE|nr:DUF5020 family protein [Paraglaciecola arctica]GAC21652.1 hypothetical protein GARC_4714 [Paraglaciecola arctica BSs20135]
MMFKKTVAIYISSLLAVTSSWSSAEVLWQDYSVSYLSGGDYKVDHNDQQILTFEHVAGTSWGDSFMFLDHLRGDDGSRSNYAEFSPRISLCKMEMVCISNGLIKDVLFASTIEMSGGATHFLYGVGLDLSIPQFQFVQLNFYRRQNDAVDNNWQMTAAWALPFEMGNQSLVYDGFIDWFNSTDDQSSSMNFTSQLKWNAAKTIGIKSPLYFGIEYVYWQNKYGIGDTTQFATNESNVNFIAKWHF